MTIFNGRLIQIFLTLMTFFHLPEAKTNIVEGISGGKVELPCYMTSTIPKDEKALLVLWYKDNVLIPIYTFDARIGPLWQGRHLSSDYLSGRAYLTTVDSPAKLVIEPVTLSDSGSYRCRVDFKKIRTSYTDSILKVIVLPSKPVIKDENGNNLESLIGPYNEGEPLKLLCEVIGGIPMPTVTWWRETILLDDSATRKRIGPIINEISIPMLKRHHFMATFTCVTSNNNISAPLSTAVTVDMNFRPLVVKIDRYNQSFSEGSPAQVNCWTAGSRPPATIEWFKGNRQLKSAFSNVSNHENVTISQLTFVPSVNDDKKTLSCSAVNPLILDSTLTDTQSLDVRYKPQLSVVMMKRPHSHTAKEGEDVTLNCNIIANPSVININWAFEGQNLCSNLSARVLVINQTLLLTNVDRFHSGMYKCTATNTRGRGESAPFDLHIQYTPRCKYKQRTNVFGTKNHRPVDVTCEVEANPQEVTFRWVFNNSRETFDVITFKNVNIKSVATYTPRTKFDYGTLLCWATNTVGVQSYPCIFSVVPTGPPEKPKNCKVCNITVDSVEIFCKQGYNGGLKQYFVLEVHDENLRSLRANLTSSVPAFLLRGLDDGSKLKLVIYAVNIEGRSDRSVITINTISDWVGSAVLSNLDDNWNVTLGPLPMILGASLAVFLVVGLSLFLVRNIRSRRQGNQKPAAKSTIELQEADNKEGSLFMNDSGNWLESASRNSVSTGNNDLLKIRKVGHSSRHVEENLVILSQSQTKQSVRTPRNSCAKKRDSSYNRQEISFSEV
ncbi:neural cell adhesion molecule 2-like [Tachypleus tridentatus]|uniref:neural cell adhesion molecule 2-like n=1 Tax=Tachypleus tridentatus TaxID=6853 RepID=UPI003FD4A02E